MGLEKRSPGALAGATGADFVGADTDEPTPSKGHKATGYRAQKRWHAANPMAEWAHMAARAAERRGFLIRPAACQRCGSEGKVDFHHSVGYELPIVGEFVCRRCHRQLHASERRAAE